MNAHKLTSIALILLAGSMILPARSQTTNDYPIHPVPFTSVKVTDAFWAPRIKLNHDVTIPIALKQCYDTFIPLERSIRLIRTNGLAKSAGKWSLT
jgi:hypothetical protein